MYMITSTARGAIPTEIWTRANLWTATLPVTCSGVVGEYERSGHRD
ncbi:hypothetical protein KCP75_21060 [Salmonella enterica subsp. enterica]|nr:hypothetical protein KCP75_21060 [Salmonella enterica subsp. enterica]